MGDNLSPPAVEDRKSKNDHPDWTIGGLLNWTAQYLLKKGSEFPRLDTEVLLAHVLQCRRIDLYARYEEKTDEEVRQRFRELIQRRVEGCPVAYLVGRKEFYSLPLKVSPAVPDNVSVPPGCAPSPPVKFFSTV